MRANDKFIDTKIFSPSDRISSSPSRNKNCANIVQLIYNPQNRQTRSITIPSKLNNIDNSTLFKILRFVANWF